MSKERSAGFILFNRENRKFLILHYHAGHWDFPKGHIEDEETIEQTARRELFEETGIKDIEVMKNFSKDFGYFFEKNKRTVYKQVFFLLASTKETDVKISHEHQGYEWLNYEEALKKLTYQNAKKMLASAQEFLKKI